jgi:hypothetical protein
LALNLTKQLSQDPEPFFFSHVSCFPSIIDSLYSLSRRILKKPLACWCRNKSVTTSTLKVISYGVQQLFIYLQKLSRLRNRVLVRTRFDFPNHLAILEAVRRRQEKSRIDFTFFTHWLNIVCVQTFTRQHIWIFILSLYSDEYSIQERPLFRW